MAQSTFSMTQHGRYEPFELQVSRGQVPYHSSLNLFGNTTALGSTAYGPLWEGLTGAGGTYTYPGSAVVMTLVSSNAADTAVVITVNGLDASYNVISENVALNGTTNVNTTKSFFRINNMQTYSGNAVGNVTAINGGVTYAKILAGQGDTQMSIYTVPAGYTFYQTYYQADSNTSVTSGAYAKLRTYLVDNAAGGVIHALSQTAFVQNLTVPLQFPLAFSEKSDIQYQLLGGGGAGAVADIYVGGILIKNEVTAVGY
jgi:effector-binding domain-containing protein